MASFLTSTPFVKAAPVKAPSTIGPIIKSSVRPLTICSFYSLHDIFKARGFGFQARRPLPVYSIPSSGDGEVDFSGPWRTTAISKLRKADIQKMLQDRGLDSKGLKAALIERLVAYENGDESANEEIVSVARQARGSVAGERKPAPLVKVPAKEEAPPADMEEMRKEIEKLDQATAELSLRIKAANETRSQEKSALEEIAEEVLAAKQELASGLALEEAMQNADRLKASLQVREKAIQMLQGVVARQAAAVGAEPEQASSSEPEQATVPETDPVVPIQPKQAVQAPVGSSRAASASQAASALAEAIGNGRPEIPLLEKATAPAAVALSYGSFFLDLVGIFKSHTKKDKRIFVDIGGALAGCLLVLKMLY